MKKLYNRFLALAVALALALSLCSCAEVESGIHDMDSSITGHTYTCEFYSNDGEKFMTLTGDKIDMTPNIVREHTYNDDDGWGYINTLSSVVTITVDGRQVNNCGSTVIFAEEGLTPDVDFQMQDIHSTTDGSLAENPLIANFEKVELKVSFWKSRIKSFVLEKIQQPRIRIDATFEKVENKAPTYYYD